MPVLGHVTGHWSRDGSLVMWPIFGHVAELWPRDHFLNTWLSFGHVNYIDYVTGFWSHDLFCCFYIFSVGYSLVLLSGQLRI